jgi:trehalose 6-phosphate synthase
VSQKVSEQTTALATQHFSRLYNRLAVVSNRLPVTIEVDGNVSMSSGGLVTAMSPVLKKHGGLWLGWPGTDMDTAEALSSFSRRRGYDLISVPLNQNDVDAFYYGFSNDVLWPLFHGFPCRCSFEPEYWRAYERVNEQFAERIAETTSQSDYVWVHDYHLLLVGQKLKRLGVHRDCGLYLHIPFPPPDTFFALPWRDQILAGMAEYDFLGFQTPRDLENFRTSLSSLPSFPVGSPASKGQSKRSPGFQAAALPISIDFDEFSEEAAVCRRNPETCPAKGFLEEEGRTLLGVDRLDYSKGIPERLKAFRQLLTDHPEHRGSIRLLQVVVPSRERLDTYRQLKEEIERLVGEINGQFATPEWTPIHYLYRSLTRRELVSTYMQADVAVITPLRDGMNLVAKEYCACRNDLDGVLILSEFAGTARQIGQAALLVNPNDIEQLARTIDYALSLPGSERRARMLAARECIRTEDIGWWIEGCLDLAVRNHRRDRPVQQAWRSPLPHWRRKPIALRPIAEASRRQVPSQVQAQTANRLKKRRVPSIDRPGYAS